MFQFSLRDQASNWLECLPGESLSEALTRFKDLLEKVPHHGIDLWLQSVGGNLRDKNAKESRALLEDLALYDNKRWNDQRDFAKPVKEISLPQDVASTSDRHFIKLRNQVQRLMEAHLDPKSSVQSARSYPTEDPQCSSHPLNSINDIQTCSKETNNSQKNQPQTVIEIRTPKSKEPEQTLEDELKDLHLNLPVLEVLAHALMYNAILDKYIESLKLGKNISTFIQGEMPEKMKDLGLFTLACRQWDSKPFDTLANLGSCVNLIPLYLFKKLKIRLLEETDQVFGLADGTKSYLVGIVKNLEEKELPGQYLSDEEIPYWTTLGNKWESEELIKKKIDWNKPPKEGDGAWHNRIELIDPDGERFKKTFQSIPTTRKLSEKENPSEIIDLDHFHDF
ncbi:hypothetical protein Tco_0950364 [Tanacetum coccineum]